MSRRNELEVLIDTLGLKGAIVTNLLFEYIRDIGKIGDCRDFVVRRISRAMTREFSEPEASDGLGLMRRQPPSEKSLGERVMKLAGKKARALEKAEAYSRAAIVAGEVARQLPAPQVAEAEKASHATTAACETRFPMNGVEHINKPICPPRPKPMLPTGGDFLPLPDEPLMTDDNDALFQKGRAEMRDRIKAAMRSTS